jgi:hypothetical protein
VSPFFNALRIATSFAKSAKSRPVRALTFVYGRSVDDAMTVFEEELEVFRTEEESAQQFFFAWLSVKDIAASDGNVLANMNSTPLFWLTADYALLLATFVTVGRIFDQDQKSDHNIDKLMRATSDSLSLFTRPALAARKVVAGVSQHKANVHAAAAYEPTQSDIRRLRGEVADWRRIYNDRYRDVRHLVFAHKRRQEIVDEVLAKTKIQWSRRLWPEPDRPARQHEQPWARAHARGFAGFPYPNTTQLAGFMKVNDTPAAGR